jgi:electron-transferring-flavoprotein dehydrogenase
VRIEKMLRRQSCAAVHLKPVNGVAVASSVTRRAIKRSVAHKSTTRCYSFLAATSSLVGGRNNRYCLVSATSPNTLTRSYSTELDPALTAERDADEVDVCIVGGGPAGLAAAIRLKQLDLEKGSGEMRVIVLEKASDMGAHTVSGAVLEPRALDELLPDWRDDPNLPESVTPVSSETMRFLTKKHAIPLPEPPQMKNHNNYVVSLNQVVKWLSEKAEELGVEVYPGFSVSELVYDETNSRVKGIATNDMGVSRDFKPKDNFQRGMEFHAKVTLLAEGCHGSLSKKVISKYNLRKDSDPQTYGLGIKEVWEVPKEQWKKGFVSHAVGWPLPSGVYGGAFMYHFGDGLVTLGLVVGLDYKNPWLSPYQEFQKMKHHPFFADVLKGGKCVSYAARALNEGGLQSIPKLSFPGGALIGCSAGFLNVPKIKGTHTAMKSGMLAAEAAFEAVNAGDENYSMEAYEGKIKDSWVWKELYEVRNVRPSFHSPLNLYGGLLYAGLDTMILRGRTPWTFHHKQTDAAATEPADSHNKIEYPKPDGVLSFDLLTSVSRTGTNHDEDEPCHLRVPDQDLDKHTDASFPKYQGVENRFCPAGVYEYIPDESKPHGVRFQINSQNCIHCKTCDIKVPTQDIDWTVPEGGDGPKYYMT